ncbi:MAG: ribonuclease H-like domain-containing protein [Candidatus Thermoplasmatota archaeon]|nr:ribonuclease H-like domain-containing protein [Candidatus Thermoplasmatota archaeon]
MLRNSFILLDGVGTQRERSLWRFGVLTWDDFEAESRIKGISEESKSRMDDELEIARARLEAHDSSYFARKVSRREHWRCLSDFGRSVAFVDIETTGLSLWSPITVLGVFDGRRMHTLLRGRDLNTRNVKALLGSVEIIVTYNGAGFDLPIIEAQFPGAVPAVPHVDLRYPLRRLGLTGGLKRIERELGLERDRRLEYMTGEDAVYLWRLWEREGKRNALELLMEYNEADCRNLKALSEHAYRHLSRLTLGTHDRFCKD